MSPQVNGRRTLRRNTNILFLFAQFFAFTNAGSQFSQYSPQSSASHHQQTNFNAPHIRAVNTPFGLIRGTLIRPPAPFASGAEHGGMPQLQPVTQFLGIPYGSAPTGHHRFKMAISAAKWPHQPKDAVRPPPSCIQSGLPTLSESEALKVTSAQRFDRLHRILPQLAPQSEDCLYMNIFVPERDQRLPPPQQALFSVLVLVHGDTDYAWGGANAHNGTLLAALGQIVVVTLNYRLGVYGFLGRCEAEARACAGNAGLSDLVAALKMLSNILPSFGADPNAVTLLGWESGAALVSLLMASPITQPKNRLFRRAILLDGTALCPWAMAPTPQAQFMRMAEELKCFNISSQGQSDPFSPMDEPMRILRCIQDNGVHNVSVAARRIAAASPSFLSAFAPIIDGQIVPNHPKVLFSAPYGSLFREIDLLAGTVIHPAHHLLANADAQHGISAERRDKMLRTLVRNTFDFHRNEILQAILNEYTDWSNPKNHPKSIRNGLMEALGDVLFTTPLIETLRAHSPDDGTNAQNAANTFFFVFGHETNGVARDAPNTGIKGSFTGDHLPYIIGSPLAEEWERNGGGPSGNQFSPEDKQLCRVMINFVANFVKSGDPTRPQPMSSLSSLEDRFHGLPWPQFSAPTREAYLEITDRPRVKNYYRNSYTQFWAGFVPVLNRRGGKDIPEDHHLLPDHFDRSTFFGIPRPATFHSSVPFPPPPMPPTPFPKELRQKLMEKAAASSTLKPSDGSSSILAQNNQANVPRHAEFNPNWGWLLLAGVALTVVNLCIWVAISRRCFRRRSESKKKFQYQSYATGGGTLPTAAPTMDMNFALMAQQRRRSSQHEWRVPTPPKELLSNNNNGNTKLPVDIVHHHHNNNNGVPSSSTTATTTGGPSGAGGIFDAIRANEAAIARRRHSLLLLRTQKRAPHATTTTSTFGHGHVHQQAPNSNRQPADNNNNNSNNSRRRMSSCSSAGAETESMLESTGSKRSSLHHQQHQPQEQEPLLAASSKCSTPGPAPTLVQIQPPSASSTGLIRLGPTPTGISPTCPRHGRAAQLLLAKASAVNGSSGDGSMQQQQQQQQLDEVQV